MAALGEQWAEHADACPHGSDNVVGGVGLTGVGGVDAQAGSVIALLHGLKRAAQGAQQALHVADVRQVWNIREGHRVVGEQCGGHEGQAGIFRTVDADVAAQGLAALNDKCVHTHEDRADAPGR